MSIRNKILVDTFSSKFQYFCLSFLTFLQVWHIYNKVLTITYHTFPMKCLPRCLIYSGIKVNNDTNLKPCFMGFWNYYLIIVCIGYREGVYDYCLISFFIGQSSCGFVLFVYFRSLIVIDKSLPLL